MKDQWRINAEIIAINPQIYGPAVSLSHRFALAGININHDDPVIKEILDRRDQ